MRITKGLIWLFLVGAVFFGGAILANRLGLVPASIQKGGDYAAVFEIGLRIFGTVVIGPPIALVVIALFAAGSDRTSLDTQGYTVMRLRSGARIFGTLLSLALSALFLLGPYYDAGIGLMLLLAPFGIFFLIAGLWCLVAKVAYDPHEVSATDYLFRVRRNYWSELKSVTYVQDAFEYHLGFEGGQKARVSTFYTGVNQLISLANTKLAGRRRY